MSKTIRAGTIASSLRSVVDPSGSHQIEWGAPVERYLTGGGGALAAFASHLNRSAEFSGYQLALGPEDLADAETMQDVLSAIIAWFQDHGWQVVL